MMKWKKRKAKEWKLWQKLKKKKFIAKKITNERERKKWVKESTEQLKSLKKVWVNECKKACTWRDGQKAI